MRWTNAYSLKQLGRFLKAVRQEKGITQNEFAQMIDVSHATLSALENGRSVSSKTLERAWQFLGLKLVLMPKDAVPGIVADPFTPHLENGDE